MSQAPIINRRIEKDVVFSPKEYFYYKKYKEHKKLPSVPKKCIICFEKSIIDDAKRIYKISELDWFRREFKLYLLVKEKVLIVNVNYGAALSAIAQEELIALGVKSFIIIGSAGSLQDNVSLSSIVIVTSAIREEGVSYHYLPPGKEVACSARLLKRAKLFTQKDNLSVLFGTAWTTDSFYRETISKTRRYKKEGVVCVDMETSALYAVAKYRKADALSILYISDSIADLKWKPDFHKANDFSLNKKLLEISLKIL